MKELSEQFNRRIGRFGRVRRGLANATLAYGVGATALGVGIAALFLLSGWTDYAPVNAVFALAAVITVAVLLVRFLVRWEGRRSNLSEAFRMEELTDDLNSRVISALDFLEWPEPSPLTEVVIDQARLDLDRPFERLLDRAVRNRLRIRFVLLLIFFLALGSTDRFGFRRLAGTVRLCALDLRETLFPTRFEIFPGTGRNLYLVGDEVETGLRFTRFRYPEVTMIRKTAGVDGDERVVLSVDEAGRAAVALKPTLESEFLVRLAFGKRITGEMKLVFTTKPLIENMQVELVYPLYTRLVPRETEGIQDRITALAGTRVNLGFVFNKALDAAELMFDDGSRMPLDVVGRFASVSFVHSQERRAALQVQDIHGFAMDSAHNVDFGLTADNQPRLFPPKHYRQDMPRTVDELAGETFGVRVEDDFGAAKCLVKWHKSTVEEPNNVKVQGEPIERVFIPPRPTAVAVFENIFREQAQSAEAGDLFTFHVAAFDNREPKAQSAVSSFFSIFIRGRGLEGGTAGSGADVRAPQLPGQGGGAQPVYQPVEGSRAIKMPEKQIIRPESYLNPERTERNTDTRGEVRPSQNRAAGDYGAVMSGARP